jgi:7-carboxy-7-deazaguanine synthase
VKTKNKKIPLVEVFGPTIQGEGAVIGQQTYFLRFGLCDYECTMCDSMHAVDPKQVKKNARWLTEEEIYQALTQWRALQSTSSTKNVTFSGGNPCIHELTDLVDQLNDNNWDIAVETQGTLRPEWLAGADVITCSPKGPGMGEKCELDKLDSFMQRFHYHTGLNMKIVVFGDPDLDFASSLFERYVEDKHDILASDFYLSLGNPFPPGMEPSVDERTGRTHRDRLILAYEALLPKIMKHPVLHRVKFLPQWHCILWSNKQGV